MKHSDDSIVIKYFDLIDEFVRVRCCSEELLSEIAAVAVSDKASYRGAVIEACLPDYNTEISAALQNEMDELCQQIVVSVKDEIQSVEQRVLDDVETTLRETYPALAQDRGAAIQRRLREEGEAAVVSAVANFHDQFGQHVDDVRKSLLKFDLRDTGETRVDLQKRFIHLWLQLLDQEIMEL